MNDEINAMFINSDFIREQELKRIEVLWRKKGDKTFVNRYKIDRRNYLRRKIINNKKKLETDRLLRDLQIRKIKRNTEGKLFYCFLKDLKSNFLL